MKFTFENFGYIDQGSVELADLTLICGPNNVGKTYISYAIYGLLKHFKHYTDFRISKEDIEILIDSGYLEIDLENYLENTSTWLEHVSHRFTERLSHFFSAPDDFFQDSKLLMLFDKLNIDDEINQRLVIGGIGEKYDIYINKEAKSKLLNIVMQLNGDEEERRKQGKFRLLSKDLIRNTISNAIFYYLMQKSLLETFSITSERTGIALFFKELDKNKNDWIDAIIESDSKDVHDLENKISRYAEPIKDNINTIRDYDNLSKQKSFLAKNRKKYHAIFDTLHELIGGNFESANGQVFYYPKPEENRERALVPVYLASSATKSLFLIDFYINCLAKENGLLLIDEPELNLHPDNQRRMASLLARLVNSGVKVVITTHSDYLVKEINNRIMLSNSILNKSELMEKNQLVDEDILQPSQVAAYGLGRKHAIDKLKVDRYGVDLTIFDVLIADANELADDIYYSIQD